MYEKLIALVLAVVCVLGLVGCNNKTVNIDLPFEVGDVENIEMYHFVGAPVSAEKEGHCCRRNHKELV